jgi:hypothetical protein
MAAFSGFENFTSGLESIATSLALIIGGVWAFRKYIVQGENLAHIESSAEIEFIGYQDESWVVELRAVLTNKGKVEHRISKFGFDLNGLAQTDGVATSEQWGGQVNFPRLLAEGSFLPERFKFFVVGPGVTARYSYLARVPKDVTMIMLHCRFAYLDRPNFGHSMEKSVRVPSFGTAAVNSDSASS